MIGSHNSFTYLPSTSWLYNKFPKYWRTQCDTISEQYDFGIRFFDIRVCWNHHKWQVCHGIVNLEVSFKSLEEICKYMEDNAPEAIYRIVLEKGGIYAKGIFIVDSHGLCNKYHHLWRIDIKSRKTWLGSVDNNNRLLFNQGYKFALVNTWEDTAHELRGYVTWKTFYKDNLKEEAKSINKNLDFFHDNTKLKEILESKDELYFLDYCTNQYTKLIYAIYIP